MDAAWNEAEVIVERRIVNHRSAGTPIEPRSLIADWRMGQLTLHITSQNPHLIRLFMAGEFGMSEDHIRVIAPDVGGGFGVKIMHYARGDPRGVGVEAAQPPGQVDGDALGAHEPRPSTAATRSTT